MLYIDHCSTVFNNFNSSFTSLCIFLFFFRGCCNLKNDVNDSTCLVTHKKIIKYVEENSYDDHLEFVH